MLQFVKVKPLHLQPQAQQPIHGHRRQTMEWHSTHLPLELTQ